MDEFVSCLISISTRKPLKSYGGIVFKKYRLLILLYETPDILSCTQRRIPPHHHHLFLQATRQTCSSKLNSPSLPPPPAKRSEPVTLPRSPPVAQQNFFPKFVPTTRFSPNPDNMKFLVVALLVALAAAEPEVQVRNLTKKIATRNKERRKEALNTWGNSVGKCHFD